MDMPRNTRISQPTTLESSRRRPLNHTEGTGASHLTESTPLLHSSGGSTDTTSGLQTGAESAPSPTNYSAFFVASLRRCLPCLKREEQTSSTQNDPISDTPADPGSVVVEPPSSSSAINIQSRSRKVLGKAPETSPGVPTYERGGSRGGSSFGSGRGGRPFSLRSDLRGEGASGSEGSRRSVDPPLSRVGFCVRGPEKRTEETEQREYPGG